jgi:type II secretory pathway component PulF
MNNTQNAPHSHRDTQDVHDMINKFLAITSFVILIGAGILFYLLLFIVPQFAAMLNESGGEIPQLTQKIINTSSYLNQNSLIALFIFLDPLILLFGWSRYIKQKVSAGRENVEAIVMKFKLINVGFVIFCLASLLVILVGMYIPVFMNSAQT